MTEPTVLLDYDGPVARVSLNRPDKLNGLTFDIFDGLIDAATDIGKRRDIRAVVLDGKGPSFCAGLDFPAVFPHKRRVAMAAIRNPLRGTNLFQHVNRIWRLLPVPVIAVTHGHVFGGGFQLAVNADFRFTTPDAQWSILEAKWGLVPDMAGTVPLSELVPLDLAKRLVMTGEVFSGQQAADWGLATGVDADPNKLADELIAQLVERSPDSVAASKKLLNEAARRGTRAQHRLERNLQVTMFRAKNTAIARKAGLSKTKPDFGPRTFG